MTTDIVNSPEKTVVALFVVVFIFIVVFIGLGVVLAVDLPGLGVVFVVGFMVDDFVVGFMVVVFFGVGFMVVVLVVGVIVVFVVVFMVVVSLTVVFFVGVGAADVDALTIGTNFLVDALRIFIVVLPLVKCTAATKHTKIKYCTIA